MSVIPPFLILSYIEEDPALAAINETQYTPSRSLYFQLRKKETRRMGPPFAPAKVFLSFADADAPMLEQLEL